MLIYSTGQSQLSNTINFKNTEHVIITLDAHYRILIVNSCFQIKTGGNPVKF